MVVNSETNIGSQADETQEPITKTVHTKNYCGWCAIATVVVTAGILALGVAIANNILTLIQSKATVNSMQDIQTLQFEINSINISLKHKIQNIRFQLNNLDHKFQAVQLQELNLNRDIQSIRRSISILTTSQDDLQDIQRLNELLIEGQPILNERYGTITTNIQNKHNDLNGQLMEIKTNQTEQQTALRPIQLGSFHNPAPNGCSSIPANIRRGIQWIQVGQYGRKQRREC